MAIPYTLHVHVIPKSSQNQVIGWEKDAAGDRWLKVRVAAVPEDGKANKELIKFLSKQLDIPVKNITVSRGENSRYKKLRLDGIEDVRVLRM